MAAPWHIRFFGGLLLRGPERTITRFRTQKTATLLAYLAYHRGRAFPREVLADMLWPGAATAGRHSLSTALSTIRRQIALPELPAERMLVVDRNHVSLSAETISSMSASSTRPCSTQRPQAPGTSGSLPSNKRSISIGASSFRASTMTGFSRSR